MSIASVGTSASFAPSLELQGTAHMAQINAAQFAASLPGNRGPGDSRPHEISAVAADFEKISLAFNKRLQFVVDHRSNEVTVKVIDAETDKVIKVLPPEELQRMHSKLKETIGFLFDEFA